MNEAHANEQNFVDEQKKITMGNIESTEISRQRGQAAANAMKRRRPPAQPTGGMDKIRDTHLQAKWSAYLPNSITPENRNDVFSCFIPERDIAIMGYGVMENGQYLNDIWALNMRNAIWQRLNFTGYVPPARSGTTAVVYGATIYLFGGECGSTYFADFHTIDLNSMTIQQIRCDTPMPCPRTGHVMAIRNQQIIIWGGFNDQILDDLWLYDIPSNTWRNLPSDVPGRDHACWAVLNNKLYISCASKIDDMIIYDFDTQKIDSIVVTGSPPSFGLKGSFLIPVDRYLFLIGGFVDKQKFAMVRAYDTVKNWWFIFYIVPDDDTTTVADGGVDSSGIFLVPRMSGGVCVFRTSTRDICVTLGRPFFSPPPIFVFHVAEGIAIMNQQLDLLDMMKLGY